MFGPGGILRGQQFVIDDRFLKYKNAYGKYANVPRSSIQTVVIEPKGIGKSTLKIVGNGTELANIVLPNTWAEKTQIWLLDQLGI